MHFSLGDTQVGSNLQDAKQLPLPGGQWVTVRTSYCADISSVIYCSLLTKLPNLFCSTNANLPEAEFPNSPPNVAPAQCHRGHMLPFAPSPLRHCSDVIGSRPSMCVMFRILRVATRTLHSNNITPAIYFNHPSPFLRLGKVGIMIMSKILWWSFLCAILFNF